jgi:hypothetical protein
MRRAAMLTEMHAGTILPSLQLRAVMVDAVWIGLQSQPFYDDSAGCLPLQSMRPQVQR